MERVLRHEERCFNGLVSPYSLHGVCAANRLLDKIRGFIIQRFFCLLCRFRVGVSRALTMQDNYL